MMQTPCLVPLALALALAQPGPMRRAPPIILSARCA